jgi:HAD superfamily hydrolase (TIGR01509 family)
MVTALCLDLMDTLIADPYRDALLAGTGLSLQEIGALRDPDAWPSFEVAAIDEATFARRFFASHADPAHTFDLAAFTSARRAGYAFLPGIEALLEETAGRVRRYVASNYPVWIEEVAERFGLLEHFDGVHASHHLGVRKPAAAFYERLLDRIGHPPALCLFVDDREVNCAAAEAAGMRAHLFVGADDLRGRLVVEGIIPAS